MDDRGVKGDAADSEGRVTGLEGCASGLECSTAASASGSFRASGSVSSASLIASGCVAVAALSSTPKVERDISENRRAWRRTGFMMKSETSDDITSTGCEWRRRWTARGGVVAAGERIDGLGRVMRRLYTSSSMDGLSVANAGCYMFSWRMLKRRNETTAVIYHMHQKRRRGVDTTIMGG